MYFPLGISRFPSEDVYFPSKFSNLERQKRLAFQLNTLKIAHHLLPHYLDPIAFSMLLMLRPTIC